MKLELFHKCCGRRCAQSFLQLFCLQLLFCFTTSIRFIYMCFQLILFSPCIMYIKFCLLWLCLFVFLEKSDKYVTLPKLFSFNRALKVRSKVNTGGTLLRSQPSWPQTVHKKQTEYVEPNAFERSFGPGECASYGNMEKTCWTPPFPVHHLHNTFTKAGFVWSTCLCMSLVVWGPP